MMPSSSVSPHYLESAPRCAALGVVSYMPFFPIAMTLRVATRRPGEKALLQLACVFFGMAIVIIH